MGAGLLVSLPCHPIHNYNLTYSGYFKMSFNPNHYDPKTIADIVFPSHSASDVIHDILSGDLPFPLSGKNGILLYGVSGTGKSTLATLLPDAIEAAKSGHPADKLYVKVQPGSNGTTVIGQIANRVLTLPLTGTRHYIVLDEVDNLTDAAMLSLKSAMNTDNAIFILTTNYLHEIEVGVISRCHRVGFNAAPPDAWLPLFKRVLTDLGAIIPPDAQIRPIISGCNGCARDIVTSAFRVSSKQKRTGGSTTGAAQGISRGTVGQILTSTKPSNAGQRP